MVSCADFKRQGVSGQLSAKPQGEFDRDRLAGRSGAEHLAAPKQHAQRPASENAMLAGLTRGTSEAEQASS
jgi:hypothetical protein